MRTSFTWAARSLAVLLAAATGACVAPRNITTSGKVTPQGEFRVAYNQGLNLGTAPLAKATSAVVDAATQASNRVTNGDTIRYSGLFTKMQTAALAYLLDPVQSTADLSVRYGVVPRVDVGYKYAFGSHVFDAQYQLLGPTGSIEKPGAGAETGTTYASVGLQFAFQRAKSFSIPFLGDVHELLGLEARRRDLIIPFTVSHSFGTEESIGAISYGLVYTHSWVGYEFAPYGRLYDRLGTKLLPDLPRQSTSYSSYGMFLNAKLGYKYLYVVPALSIYYQNYGTYTLLDGSTTSFSGVTFIPSLGLQARIPSWRK